ncbi:MAG: hypothetical protein FJY99_07365 [Candidatus Sericytochromatia bacterium]|nr:hypothetical protein [Candidatus Tanganyikabacteria bacterium]
MKRLRVPARRLGLTAILLAGCAGAPDRYVATLEVAMLGAEPGRRVALAIRDGVWRVDFRDAQGSFALGWRGRPRWVLFAGGLSRQMDLEPVVRRHGLPDPGDLATVPFSSSAWMKAARPIDVPGRISGVACRLWQCEASGSVERFWLAEEDGVPRRFERAAPDGTLLAQLDWRDVAVGGDLPDASFSVPAGTLGLPALPSGI